MCSYRTEHNRSKYIKLSIYQFHIVTYQPNIKLTTGIYGSHIYNKTKVVVYYGSTVHSLSACKWTVLQNKHVPFQPLMNPPSCIIALYAKNDQAIGEQCSLSISHVQYTFIPVAVISNLWIIPSNPKTLGSTIMKNCPD